MYTGTQLTLFHGMDSKVSTHKTQNMEIFEVEMYLYSWQNGVKEKREVFRPAHAAFWSGNFIDFLLASCITIHGMLNEMSLTLFIVCYVLRFPPSLHILIYVDDAIYMWDNAMMC